MSPQRVFTDVATNTDVAQRVFTMTLSPDGSVQANDRYSINMLRPIDNLIDVNFGNFTPGKDPITRNIVITNNKPATPVKVTKAEVSVPGFVTDVVPTQEGVSYTVVVKANDKVKKGVVDGKVTHYTTDKEKEKIEIPLKGEAL